MASTSAAGSARHGAHMYFAHKQNVLALYGIPPETVPAYAVELHDVLVTSMRALPPNRGAVSCALPPPHTQVVVLRHVTRHLIQGHTSWQRPRNVLARGYRLAGANGSLELRHVNWQAEWLCGPAWQWLLDQIGVQRMVALLTCPHTMLFRVLPQGNAHQVAGIALDEFLKPGAAVAASDAGGAAAVRRTVSVNEASSGHDTAGAVTAAGVRRTASDVGLTGAPHSISGATAAPPPSRPPAHHVVSWKSRWELPRSDLQPRSSLSSSCLGPAVAVPPDPAARYSVVRRLYHGTATFPRTSGLDDDHIFNRVLRLQPSQQANRAVALQRPSKAATSALQLLQHTGAATEALPAARVEQLRDVAWRAALRPATHVPQPAEDASNNAARAVILHVFVEAPHCRDLRLFNEGNGGATGHAASSRGFPRGLLQAVPAFRELLQRHAALSYEQLLGIHCKLPSELLNLKRDASATLYPLELATPAADVMNFVRHCLAACIPAALWGGAAAKRHVLSQCWRWIGAGVSDRFVLGDVLRGFPTSGFTVFAAGRCSHTGEDLRHRYACTWLLWLLLCLVTPLLRMHFYVTTSEVEHHKTLYFRKPVWAFLTRRATQALAEQLQLRRIGTMELVKTLKESSRKELGTARVRLVPKRTGMRPVMNLSVGTRLSHDQLLTMQKRELRRQTDGVPPGGGAPVRMSSTAIRTIVGDTGSLEVKPINRTIGPLLDVLRRQRRAFPNLTGSATFGLDGAHAALRAFALRRDTTRPVHMVSCDVKAAYDTVDQEKVLECVRHFLPESQNVYVLRTFVVLRIERGPPERIRSRYLRIAMLPGDKDSFLSLAGRLARMFRHAVFIDGTEYTRVSRDELIRMLAAHVCVHVVQLARHRFYQQRRGIPQGSSLSSLLCNVYLGHMEWNEVVPALVGDASPPKHASLLMRLTDDFVCLTQDAYVPARFINVMHAGMPAYGVQVSRDKSATSTPLRTPLGNDAQAPVLPSIAADARGAAPALRWCGLVLHPHNMNVSVDWSRYAGSGRLRQRVSMPGHVLTRAQLLKWCVAFLRPRCHPVCYDASLHSPFSAAWNIFEVSAVACMKLVAVLRGGAGIPDAAVTWTLHKAASALWDMMMHRIKIACEEQHPFFPGALGVQRRTAVIVPALAETAAEARADPACALRRDEVVWLFLAAGRAVLVRAGDRWCAVVSRLDQRMSVFEVGGDASAHAGPPQIRPSIITAARSDHPDLRAITWR